MEVNKELVVKKLDGYIGSILNGDIEITEDVPKCIYQLADLCQSLTGDQTTKINTLFEEVLGRNVTLENTQTISIFAQILRDYGKEGDK